MTLNYTIPLPPVTKKNSQRILRTSNGRPFIAQSKKYMEYARAALLYLKPPPGGPIDFPVNVKMVFYVGTKRRVDLVNLQEAALDILVAARVLKDDNSGIVADMDGSRVYYDKENTRT